ncbi:hypothetical protein Rsub_03473 [Raphidocelis subcapitata]|uniref:Uncharacterized protein n=1 Tax=Raphidocelis subcapitata TaxID=307507 RepID=A0A2V0NZY2_9CHLO|nr:hypothetical protein Rsub_03473 [Raphidocelis subcapitata]|eukprot:GBF90477.1 hypothetical protein Rsub_03473 [Raphidocelis subcapitata]
MPPSHAAPPAPCPPAPAPLFPAGVVLVKRHASLDDAGPHAQGGRHLFACLARALAARLPAPHGAAHAAPCARVAVVCHASRERVMAAAAGGGWLRDLRPAGGGVEGAAWLRRHPSSSSGGSSRGSSSSSSGGGEVWVSHAAAFDPADLPALAASCAAVLAAQQAGSGGDGATTAEAAAAAAGPVVVISDADECHSSAAGAAAAALAAALQGLPLRPRPRLVFLIQNLHHLPFGPCGCAPRAAPLLRAWAGADGVLAVSGFVAAYLERHWGEGAGGAGSRSGGGGGGGGSTADAGAEADSSGGGDLAEDAAGSGVASRPRVRVVSPASLGALGAPPWRDCGAAALARLWPDGGGAAAGPAPAGDAAAAPPAAARRPVVGMLKLSPEKGAAVFFGLAGRMPDCDFLAVDCRPSDPDCQPVAGAGDGWSSGSRSCSGGGSSGIGGAAGGGSEAAAAPPPNVRLVPPTGDLDGLLGRMDVVMVPSLLEEAFGLVVLDAALRGLPVVAAAAGALPEAAAAAGGGAAIVPVAAARFPLACGACGGGGGGGGGGGCIHGSTCSDGAPACGCACACGGADRTPRPSWERRQLPPAREQPLAEWEAALRRLLASRAAYAAASEAARCGARARVEAALGGGEVGGLLAWLAGDAGDAG